MAATAGGSRDSGLTLHRPVNHRTAVFNAVAPFLARWATRMGRDGNAIVSAGAQLALVRTARPKSVPVIMNVDRQAAVRYARHSSDQSRLTVPALHSGLAVVTMRFRFRWRRSGSIGLGGFLESRLAGDFDGRVGDAIQNR